MNSDLTEFLCISPSALEVSGLDENKRESQRGGSWCDETIHPSSHVVEIRNLLIRRSSGNSINYSPTQLYDRCTGRGNGRSGASKNRLSAGRSVHYPV